MTQHPIRTARADDADALGVVMFRAIHEGASPYTEAQRTAWLARPNRGPDWADRLAAQFVVLAAPDAITGFMTLTPAGHIDLAFILPDARGQGLFAALFARIEAEARRKRILRLTTHASLMAQPAFARQGFAIEHHETIEIQDHRLARAAMSKSL
ncbi:GNAT family N-acetyltransferase [Marivita hallyeonensis]|uniref:Acetyltransferase, GNAT family n=1 Tax=Marivita hallyeonensis TaxID=996342 RepID=A0A1M5P9I2_9RHOB|nr:GNAT family N-acetyltransferase [Marivita hallyeonensis]SHG97903.1 Acetyltransferase, GNAT family [Marivita hallyeonensis]